MTAMSGLSVNGHVGTLDGPAPRDPVSSTGQAPDAAGTPGSGVQVNHRKLKFICAGCGHEYANPRDLWDCVEERLGEES